MGVDMVSKSTDYQAIQHDEIEALRSIYMDDFEEHVQRTAWNVGTLSSLRNSPKNKVSEVEEGLFHWPISLSHRIR